MADLPPALSGALSTRYRIERELGTGGMATVYLARDLKHDRDVAIKVLRGDVAAAVGAERFLDEIRTTALLKHPHILPLFDSGSADGALFFVMPFIDGESLRQRIRRDQRLPIDRVVRILRELADALAHAHAKGVIHRDVKPDNVLISDRHVYLADFGIARALAAHAPESTITATGMMVGTPAYMAPEQVVAGPIDHRTDIYALGALGYELVTGSPPFTGSSQEVITAQLTRLPDPVSRHRVETPQPLADLIMRCLQKEPEQRWQRIDDLLPILDHLSVPARAPVPRGRVSTVATYAAALLLVVALTVGGMYVSDQMRRPDSLVIGRIVRITSEPGLELDPALSPDGRTIAYAAGPIGQMRIYVRQIAGGRMAPLTEDGVAVAQRWPQWSSDGSRVVFQAGRQRLSDRTLFGAAMIYQVPALGGTPRRLFGPLPEGRALGPAWSPDNAQVIFSASDGLYVVSADGNDAPRLITRGLDLHSPRWSSDRSKIAYVRQGSLFTFGEESLGNVSNSTIEVLWPESGQVNTLTTGNWLDTNPVWMPDNRTLLFISSRGGGRDVYRVRLTAAGEAEAEPERVTSGLNAHTISLAPDGKLLAYASYTPSANIWSIPIPEKEVASIADARQITFGNEKIEKVAISPDGQWVAFCVRGELRVIAPDGSGERVLVRSGGPGDHPEPAYPVWSRDSRTIYYKAYDRDRVSTIWAVPGAGGASRLLVRFDDPSRRSLRREFATDGHRFYFTIARDESDIWAMELIQK